MIRARGSVALSVVFCLIGLNVWGSDLKENPIVIGHARFTVISEGLIRLEYQAKGQFLDQPTMFAFDREARTSDFEFRQAGGVSHISTSRFELIYRDDGQSFSAQNLSVKIFSHSGENPSQTFATWYPGKKNEHNLGGTITSLDRVDGPTPLGDGLLSRDGWYVIDDTRKPVLANGWVHAANLSAGMDAYLFAYATDYKSALKSLTKVSGRVALPRKYVLGSWYSRYWPYNSTEYRGIVNEYEQHDFPLDIMVMDMDWHTDGWTGYTWNRKLLPDAEELLGWFHERNIHVTLNDHPASGIGPQEVPYPEFMRQMGENPSSQATIPFDSANKKYLETFFRTTHVPLQSEGVDFWWLDWQQEIATAGIPALDNLPWLNKFYFERSADNGLRGQSFSRWGGWGDQRYPIQFSGDASTNWKMLEFEIPFTTTSSNVGCYYWSHDIGGHMGARNEESYVRWVQFGALSTALRLHSTRTAEMDRRPWKYSPEAEESIRRSFHLRSELFPYIYTSVQQGYADSTPLMRSLYFEFPELEDSYRNPQEYLFGDNILVAPITSPGVGPTKVASQKVWFPPAENDWYQWRTGERFAGGIKAIVTSDLNDFPFFARGGVPIPMQPYSARMASTPLTTLVIRTYRGYERSQGSSTLYEDDGITRAHERGDYATTKLSYRRDVASDTVTVAPVSGHFAGQPAARSYVFELGLDSKKLWRAIHAYVNGVPAEVELASGIARVKTAPIDIHEKVEIRFDLPSR